MAFYEWTPDLQVNVGKIDEQHKKWISLIDQMHEAMSAGKGKDISQKILDEMIAYTKYHFSMEEELMDKHDYPFSSVHKGEHAKFTQKVEELGEEHKSGKIGLTLDIMKFLKEWLNSHIKGIDVQFGKHLNQKGVK